MPNHVHTHGDAPPHEHADATPGHTHDASGNVVGATGSHGFGGPSTGTTAPGTTAAGTTAAGATAAGAAAGTHGHPGMADHSHADATPGHTHDAERREEVRVGPSGGGMAGRIILTLLGAAGLIGGAFLSWWAFEEGQVPPGTETAGVNTNYSIFYSTDFPFGASLIESAGAVTILLGILALLGLVFRTGWLTTLAGVLGLVAFGLFVLTLYRVPDPSLSVANIGLGAWLVLAGSILSVIAGFFGARPRVVTRSY